VHEQHDMHPVFSGAVSSFWQMSHAASNFSILERRFQSFPFLRIITEIFYGFNSNETNEFEQKDVNLD
jgi:hypothetical protein